MEVIRQSVVCARVYVCVRAHAHAASQSVLGDTPQIDWPWPWPCPRLRITESERCDKQLCGSQVNQVEAEEDSGSRPFRPQNSLKTE